MHFAFIPYGKRLWVETLLRDMEAQKHWLPMKKGKEEIKVPIQGSVRVMPGGVYEYVFPKEDLDMVLHTLLKKKENWYNIKEAILMLARRYLKLKKIPEYKKEKYYLWLTEHVNIIPVGIREDKDIVAPEGKYKGWTHEGI